MPTKSKNVKPKVVKPKVVKPKVVKPKVVKPKVVKPKVVKPKVVKPKVVKSLIPKQETKHGKRLTDIQRMMAVGLRDNGRNTLTPQNRMKEVAKTYKAMGGKDRWVAPENHLPSHLNERLPPSGMMNVGRPTGYLGIMNTNHNRLNKNM
jgi:hypothetical protein